MNNRKPHLTHGRYLAAFEDYRRAVEASGGWIEDVEMDDRGLLTWSAGTAAGRAGTEQLEQMHAKHFRDIEVAYLRQLRADASESTPPPP